MNGSRIASVIPSNLSKGLACNGCYGTASGVTSCRSTDLCGGSSTGRKSCFHSETLEKLIGEVQNACNPKQGWLFGNGFLNQRPEP